MDVSSWQSGLTLANFKALKSLGVKTVIVKLTQGTDYTNPYAIQQITYANEAGLNVDLYHYATFGTLAEAQAESNYLLSVLKKDNIAKSVLLFADMESTSTYTVNIQSYLTSFWSILSNAGYTNHGVYTFASYLYRAAVSNTVGTSRTWIAQYPYHPSSSNMLNSTYGAWQLSSTALLSGYSGYLDVTHDYTGFLENSAGTNTFGSTTSASSSSSSSSSTTSSSSSTESNYTGQKYIDGYWYYYENGTKVTGWKYISSQGKWVYYDSNGHMKKGQAYIGGYYYYFDEASGKRVTGWKYISAQGKWVYYDSNGHMKKGQA
ncbi:GH25 family lysozyme, partial [Liquorilactobacillus hordei]|uniref:GH25 family lysozyme n=1 Tax=Liquorilactobacillus hordei TaxID=468911 RepID=UPI0039E7A428